MIFENSTIFRCTKVVKLCGLPGTILCMEYVIGKIRRLNGPALTLAVLSILIALWILLAIMFAFGGSMIRSMGVGSSNEVKVVPCAKCSNCACPRIAGTAQCLCPR